MRYPEKLLNYFYHRSHAGSLSRELPNIRWSHIGQIESREALSLYVDYQREIILTARFQAKGSPALIAAGEFICGWLEKKGRQEILGLTPELILASLGLPQTNIHIAHLIITAVKRLELC